MWKNFKIRTKMLIGFALVLAVFTVSVAVTGSLMGNVAAENSHIIETTIPGQTICSNLDESAYELFIAMRTLQYLKNDEATAEVQRRRADVQKQMDELAAFHAKEPETVATAYLVEKVVPDLNKYFESIDHTIASIAKRNAADAALVVTSRAMSASAADLQRNLWEYLKNNGQNLSADVYQERMAELERANNIVIRIGDARRVLLHANDTGDNETSVATIKTLEDIVKEVAGLGASLAVQEHRQITENLQISVAEYIKEAHGFVAAFNELDSSTNERNAMRERVNAETSESLNMSEARIRARSEVNLTHLGNAITIMYSSTAFSVLLGLVVAFFISRGIANPLSTIVDLAKRAGDGDLTIEKEDFRYHGKDELGVLVEAMSTMIEAQEDAMKQVILVSDGLAGSAGTLSAISEETNASMGEVKVSVEQVSDLSESNGAALQECNAGIEEMSAGADTVAQSATDSAAFIAQTTEASNRAIQTVNRVIDGMRGVDLNSKESENKIRQLVASVENVSSFVSVITGIADQTNLLALNAAIEAARAGEVGRGFAVVAEEVRKLAEESARAAQNVNSIISELQSGAHESIEATVEAGRKLGDTLTQAEQAQGELNAALKEMNKANESIQNIAAVAQEQAASSKEVASAIDSATKSTMDMVETVSNIRRASEDTARAAQGVAEHSEAMNEHAHNLTEVLSHFKLHNNGQTLKALRAK